MPLFDVIHHVAIIVSDYKASREFYVDKLGFEVVRENYRADRGDWKLDLRIGQSELEIFGRPNNPARVTNPSSARKDSPVEITSSTIRTRLPFMYSASLPSRQSVCQCPVVIERTSAVNTSCM